MIGFKYMKRACIKVNTKKDEQNASSIPPLKINFVRMKQKIKFQGLLLIFCLLPALTVAQSIKIKTLLPSPKHGSSVFSMFIFIFCYIKEIRNYGRNTTVTQSMKSIVTACDWTCSRTP